MVSGDESAQVCVWDVETGDMVFHFADLHTSKMTAMAFDEAGRRLITGGNDGTVRVWNFSNGQLLKELRNEGSSEVRVAQHGTHARRRCTALTHRVDAPCDGRTV